MKLRNQLLAICCLLVFIAFGVLYFKAWVVQKPFGIILFIGDGLAPRDFTAARIFEGGADHRLTLEKFPRVALLSTFSNDFAVSDAAAAATALATGVKANNRALAIGPDGNALSSILDEARKAGRAVGVVTNGRLTDAGAAAFYAHATSGADTDTIAAQFVDAAQLDVALGGGAHDFTPEAKGGRRKDGRDLLVELKQKDVDLVRTRAELEEAAPFRTRPFIGVFATGPLAFGNQLDAPQPSLSEMVERAIQILQFNTGGYLLVVDAELISRAAEQNDGEHLITETLELNRAVATAMKFAGEKTLIIATGKHTVGGMTMNGYPLRQDRGVALLGKNAFGYPSISWASGPRGPRPAAAMPAPENEQPAPPSDTSAQDAPAAFYAPSAIEIVSDVFALGIGPGSEELHGFQDNTVIFSILKKSL